MSHTMHKGNGGPVIKDLVSTVAITLQITLKVLKNVHRPLSSSSLLVIEEDYLFYTVLIHPVVS